MERETKRIDSALLKRYLEGTASPDEIKWVDRWYESLDRVPDNLHPMAGAHIRRRVLYNLFPKPVYRLAFIASAAAAVLLLFLVHAVFQLPRKQPTTVKDFQVRTMKGERKKMTLRDGSIVWLNAESSLRVAQGFGEKHRNLKLVGEAYFEVSPNQDLPFIIYAAGIQTSVLGTSFNVKAYPAYRQVKVAVSSGKVRVADLSAAPQDHQGFLLEKGQAIHYNLDQHQALLRTENPTDQSPWLANKLVIDHYNLQEIGFELSRYYALPVKIQGEMEKSEHYTIALGRVALSEALGVLSSLTKKNIYEKDGIIWITQSSSE